MRITLHQEDALRYMHDDAAGVQTALRLASACEEIRKRSVLQVSLEDAAKFAGIERTYFCRAFKKHMGIGFAAWLREIRVAHAKDLLCLPEIRITDIALMCGFSDLSSFERNFRNSVGLTPRQYRKELQNRSGISQFIHFHAGF